MGHSYFRRCRWKRRPWSVLALLRLELRRKGIFLPTILDLVLNLYQGSGGDTIGALFTPLYVQMSMYAGTVICM